MNFDCVGVYDTPTLVGHFVFSPREREKRDRRASSENKREGWKKKKQNESEETEEIETFPFYPYLLYMDSRPCPTVRQYQLDAPVNPEMKYQWTDDRRRDRQTHGHPT